jgi:HTH-type transcriptional regulator, sugar sensing transcriptional regulator
MDVESTLEELGLKGKKATVYLTVLKIGSGTATEIAALSSLKRPTCYDILDDLMGQGLVNQTHKGSRRYFSAEDPQRLLDNHRAKEEKIKNVLPQLTAFYDNASNKPTVRLYDGLEGIKKAEFEILDSTKCEYYYFGSLQSLESVLGKEFLKDLVAERVKRGIWSNALRVKSRELEGMPFMQDSEEFLRRVKYMPYPILGEIVTMTVTDNKVFILSSSKECYALIIESSEMVNLMKVIWHSCWQGADT